MSRTPMLAALVVALVGCRPPAVPPATPATGAPAPPRAAAARFAAYPELATAGRLRALVVNGDTEDRHTANVERAVSALRTLGAGADDVLVASAAAGTATRAGLAGLVAALRARLGARDRVVVYVTGHGVRGAFVLQGGTPLPHADFVALMRPLAQTDAVFVFDACYAGAVPALLVDAGFRAVAMAPSVEGTESQCQLFAPVFWNALAAGVDTDGDGRTTLEEIFTTSIDVYTRERGKRGLPPSAGVFRRPVSELGSLGDALDGNVLLDLHTAWCPPCRALGAEIDGFRRRTRDRVAVWGVDWEKNDVREGVRAYLRLHAPDLRVDAYPTLVWLKNGSVVGVQRGLQSADALAREATALFGPEPAR